MLTLQGQDPDREHALLGRRCAGLDNEMFCMDTTQKLFVDAQKVVKVMSQALE